MFSVPVWTNTLISEILQQAADSNKFSMAYNKENFHKSSEGTGDWYGIARSLELVAHFLKVANDVVWIIFEKALNTKCVDSQVIAPRKN